MRDERRGERRGERREERGERRDELREERGELRGEERGEPRDGEGHNHLRGLLEAEAHQEGACMGSNAVKAVASWRRGGVASRPRWR